MLVQPFPEVIWHSTPEGYENLVEVTDSRQHPLGIVALVRSDCPYCQVLKENVLPEIESAFKERLWIRTVAIREDDSNTVAPTIMILRYGVVEGYLEGLPTAGRLREILDNSQAW